MLEAETLLKECSGYLKPDDLARLQSAYQFSESAHHGQFRNSGEPYVSHPVAVAGILAGLHLDAQALAVVGAQAEGDDGAFAAFFLRHVGQGIVLGDGEAQDLEG